MLTDLLRFIKELPFIVKITQQQSRQEGLGPREQQWWERFVTQIKYDAAKMNAGIVPNGNPTMKGRIEINGRELLPGPLELHIDKPPFPAREDDLQEPPTYWAIRIDEGNFEILHNRTREAYAYGRGKNENCETIEIISVQVVREMEIEALSERILLVFLPHPIRCEVPKIKSTPSNTK